MKAYSKAKQFVIRYERHLSSAGLIGGFLFDIYALQRIDALFDEIVIFLHVLFAALIIIFFSYLEAKRSKNKILEWVRIISPTLLQMTLGGCFGAYLVFYFRSASLGVSWPFILFLAGVFVVNEAFRERLERFELQISLFFIALFAFLIYFIPVTLGRMGSLIFLLSGGVSLGVMAALLYVVYKVHPVKLKERRTATVIVIGSIFILINVLYFLNIIPPIPLSLKNADVAHAIERTSSGDYQLTIEKKHWYDIFFPSETIHINAGQPVYVFSSVFAPTRLAMNIVHEWQYYNVSLRRWVTASLTSFEIIGGRDDGFRGYSFKTAVFSGSWRVNIETERGQVIGRIRFEIDEVGRTGALTNIIE